ncbi:MAG: alpha/beta hydrolase [Cytophagales bacterium]|nr:MAG: alpha/beta hydrolase [Cytophagales bacterium]
MQASTHFITIGQSKLSYQKYGEGAEIWLCFHGFGQDHSFIMPLVHSLQKACTFYSFDMFFHGQSHWEEASEAISSVFWQQCLEVFFLQESSINTFSVLGYSLGGKFALATLLAQPQRVKKMVLVASEGIEEHRVYKIATRNSWGRFFFKKFTHQAHSPIPWLLDGAQKMRLIPTKTHHFIQQQWQSPENRKKLYRTWQLTRGLFFQPIVVAELLCKYQIVTHFVIGNHDTVVPFARVRALYKLLPDALKILTFVDAKHHQIIRNMENNILILPS